MDTSLDFPAVAEERDGSGTLLARYDSGDDLIRMDRGGVPYYYVFDGLGSTRALTGAAGAVTDTYAFDAFGEQAAADPGSTVNPFGFDAQQFDAPTQTYFLRARYYDQADGRFLSQDSDWGSNEDPVSLHRYLYASDDPANRIDPSGNDDDSIEEVSLTQSIGQTLNSMATGVYVRVLTFASQNPGLVRLALYGQGAIQLYSYFADPDAAAAAAGTGTLSADIELLGDLSSDVRSAFAIFKNLDEYERATGIVARLTQDSLGKGSRAGSVDPTGWDLMPVNRGRGHLLANILGGPGNVPENLVPLFQNPTNTPEMRAIELRVRDAIQDQNMTVYYRVTPIYDGSNPVPVSIRIEAEGSNNAGNTLSINELIQNRDRQ